MHVRTSMRVYSNTFIITACLCNYAVVKSLPYAYYVHGFLLLFLLQSQIREVYKNLPNDKKLKLCERCVVMLLSFSTLPAYDIMNKLPSRIDSDYNGVIVQAVCDGLGDRVSLEDVRCV